MCVDPFSSTELSTSLLAFSSSRDTPAAEQIEDFEHDRSSLALMREELRPTEPQDYYWAGIHLLLIRQNKGLHPPATRSSRRRSAGLPPVRDKTNAGRMKNDRLIAL
jgi:hypothetical protein